MKASSSAKVAGDATKFLNQLRWFSWVQALPDLPEQYVNGEILPNLND
jgi:hypothetical protein